MKHTYTEVYKFTSPEQYWRGVPHTDSIEFLAGTLLDDKLTVARASKGKRLFDQVLTVEEYNNSVNANTEPEEDGQELIRVIVVI